MLVLIFIFSVNVGGGSFYLTSAFSGSRLWLIMANKQINKCIVECIALYLCFTFQLKWTVYLLHGDNFAPSPKNHIRRHCPPARRSSLPRVTPGAVTMCRSMGRRPLPGIRGATGRGGDSYAGVASIFVHLFGSVGLQKPHQHRY